MYVCVHVCVSVFLYTSVTKSQPYLHTIHTRAPSVSAAHTQLVYKLALHTLVLHTYHLLVLHTYYAHQGSLSPSSTHSHTQLYCTYSVIHTYHSPYLHTTYCILHTYHAHQGSLSLSSTHTHTHTQLYCTYCVLHTYHLLCLTCIPYTPGLPQSLQHTHSSCCMQRR